MYQGAYAYLSERPGKKGLSGVIMHTYPSDPGKRDFPGSLIGTFCTNIIFIQASYGISESSPIAKLHIKHPNKSRLSVDSGGRVLLPKKIRQRLGLAAGDELEVEFPVAGLDQAGEDAILLRVVRPEVPLRREGKFRVYRGGEAPAPVDVAGMIAAERKARSESILPGSTALPTTVEGAEP
jgi:AbrB family looped-hinge helix DNA binding protein